MLSQKALGVQTVLPEQVLLSNSSYGNCYLGGWYELRID